MITQRLFFRSAHLRREFADGGARHRFIGNCHIALGALLPGIGGTATRMGHTEVLYVMELIGIVLIWIGYTYNVRPGARGVPAGATSSSSPASAT